MLHVVQKPISGPGGTTIPSGAIVDTASWRNARQLVNQRYLRVATPDDLANAVEDDDENIPEVEAPVPTLKARKKKGAKSAKSAKVKH